MARSTKEEALETRSRILDAAEHVFFEQGVASTSLADVAKQAQVTRGAIYWHFRNKSDLFNAMCDRVRLPMETMLEENANPRQADPLGEFVRGGVDVLKKAVTDPRCRKVFDIIYNKWEYVSDSDPILIRQRECRLRAILLIEQVFKNAIACGQLPANLNIRLAALYMHGSFNGFLSEWFFAPDSFNLAEDAESLLLVSIHALKTAPVLIGEPEHKKAP